MSLLHDISESITGDIIPTKIPKSKKNHLENKTMNSILSQLPENLQSDYLSIWDEYVKNNSLESNLLHEIDKLEMAMQATIYSKEFSDKSFSEFLNTADSVIKHPELKKIFNLLKRDCNLNRV